MENKGSNLIEFVIEDKNKLDYLNKQKNDEDLINKLHSLEDVIFQESLREKKIPNEGEIKTDNQNSLIVEIDEQDYQNLDNLDENNFVNVDMNENSCEYNEQDNKNLIHP